MPDLLDLLFIMKFNVSIDEMITMSLTLPLIDALDTSCIDNRNSANSSTRRFLVIRRTFFARSNSSEDCLTLRRWL